MAKKENKSESKSKKHFFKDFKAELKKVIWPTPKQLVNNTVAVITIVLITAAIVFVLDVVFDMTNKYGISNLQNIVSEKFTTEEDTENQDNATETTDTTESTEENSEDTVEGTDQETENTSTDGENVENTETNTVE